MTSKLRAGTTIVGLAVVALTAGALLPRFSVRQERRAVVAVDSATALLPNAAANERIAALEAERASGDADARELASLGLAYLSQARAEAEPAFLTKADAALTDSLAVEPRDNFEAFVGRAALANARHDFSGSIVWARRAIALNPHDSAPHGLLGDALFELGRVEAADAAYQRMIDLRPDMASYVRASYALGYGGNVTGAIEAMELALQAAASPADQAWVHHQLGDIYQGAGRYRRAAQENRLGMQLAPGYAPPQVGFAESLIARGRVEDAIGVVERAIATLPAIEYEMTLGELYEAAGRNEEAARQYDRAAAVLARYRAHGMLPDADLILFYVDHGFRMEAALDEARAIYADRPTAKTADALAWALYRSGDSGTAWSYAREAISQDAPDPGHLFHAGMIWLALGDEAKGERFLSRALAVDPAFSVLQAPLARRLLAG